MKHCFRTVAAAAFMMTSAGARAEVFDIDAVKLPPVKRAPTVSPGGISTLDVIIDDDATALLGKGFDVFTGEVKAEAACLESDGHDGPTPPDAPPTTGDDIFFNDTFNSVRSFTNSAKSGVSFGFTYKILSGSFENNNSTESQLNSTDAFGRFYRRIIKKVQFRDGGRWSAQARQWLKPKRISAFIKACGTHYVRALHWGHSLDQTFRFSLKDGMRTSENSNSLSVGVGQLLNFGINDTNSAKSVTNLSTVSHSGHNHGTAVAPDLKNDTSSVQALYQYATYQYPKAVTDSKSKGDILLLDIRPYRERATLSNLSLIPKWPEEIFQELQAKQDLVADLATAVLNLRFAKKLSQMDYEALYSSPPYSELVARSDAIVAAQSKFKTAVDQCKALAGSQTAPAAAARKLCTDGINAALNQDDLKAATLVRKL